MQVTVDYIYLSGLRAEPRSREFDIPEDTDLKQWVEKNFPHEEGPFTNWNPEVHDASGKVIYERFDGLL